MLALNCYVNIHKIKTKVMLRKDSHFGQFPLSKSHTVLFPVTKHRMQLNSYQTKLPYVGIPLL